MKTRYLKLGSIWIVAMLLGYMLPAQAKKTLNFTTISGVVKDQETHKTLEYVNISIPGTSIGTVTNADGGFMIKVADSIQAERLEISYLGYRNQILPITGEDVDDVTVYLLPNTNKLPEILIRAIDPLNLIKEAMKKVPENNSLSEDMLTGFYRETVKKRRNYINVTEAIVNVYKTPYSEDSEKEKVQVFKGRQLVSPKVGDTLIVKLQGGPTMPIYADVVKNRDLILGEDALHNYKFSMDSPVMLDKRPHLVVRFSPKTEQFYPLFYGKFYIDETTLAFTQAEFSYSMKDRKKVTNAILRKKPFNLRFKPEELTFLVTYKNEGGYTYLNYVRNEIKFKCDWKRRLFSTGYTVVSEMVVTDKDLNSRKTIPNRDAFKQKHILSDDVNSFYDENFWEGYNIIAPTESLESAVNKLKKKYD